MKDRNPSAANPSAWIIRLPEVNILFKSFASFICFETKKLLENFVRSEFNDESIGQLRCLAKDFAKLRCERSDWFFNPQ